MASVREIRVYPVKALDPAVMPAARVLASGALAWDRRFALVDSRGRFVNGKNQPLVHAVRAAFDLDRGEISLDGRAFSLEREGDAIAAWFSDRFGEPLVWREDALCGFPDDTVSPGPTLVSEATLAAVAGWFELPVDEVRLRFRPNAEITGVEPFAEDRWYGRAIGVGSVVFDAVNPCARCVVPSRAAHGGEPTAGFQKRFAELRKQHLPPWAESRHFNHFYRLCVNTRLAALEAGKTIAVGDDVVDLA